MLTVSERTAAPKRDPVVCGELDNNTDNLDEDNHEHGLLIADEVRKSLVIGTHPNRCTVGSTMTVPVIFPIHWTEVSAGSVGDILDEMMDLRLLLSE